MACTAYHSQLVWKTFQFKPLCPLPWSGQFFLEVAWEGEEISHHFFLCWEWRSDGEVDRSKEKGRKIKKITGVRHETWTVEVGGHLQMSTERRKLESVMLLTCKLRLKRDALMCKNGSTA